jgi:hypothetical protein
MSQAIQLSFVESETHSHELTEHHRAHWVSNSMAMIKKLLACCWLENVYIRTNMFKSKTRQTKQNKKIKMGKWE